MTIELYLRDGSRYSPIVDKEELRLRELTPVDDLQVFIREATQTVEDQLRLEDQGWINLSGTSADVIPAAARITNLKISRLYYAKDPLGKQAIRLWTDYTFGSGMTFNAKEDKTQEVLTKYWKSPKNRSVLSARGQRKSSDKLLVDGEIFFVQFLGSSGEVTVRWIDPLEITEIITDPEDIETVMFYRRDWADRQGGQHIDYYRSPDNLKNEVTKNAVGQAVDKTSDGIVSHLTYNTITQRGNPLLLPALDWIRQYRRFLASRIAVMLALARFAWSSKVAGGQAAVDAVKTTTNEQEIAAGSHLIENLGVDTKPIKTESGAKNAADDGRMIKLQVSAATGWPEQYFGDISTGNLATAKTVELPVQKMIQSLQKVWADFYQEMDEIVLAHNRVTPDNWYVDRDFPLIAPRDVAAAADAIQKVVTIFPQFASSPDIQQVALMILGIDDTAEVLDALEEAIKKNPAPELLRAVKQLREAISKNGEKEKQNV